MEHFNHTSFSTWTRNLFLFLYISLHFVLYSSVCLYLLLNLSPCTFVDAYGCELQKRKLPTELSVLGCELLRHIYITFAQKSCRWIMNTVLKLTGKTDKKIELNSTTLFCNEQPTVVSSVHDCNFVPSGT